MGLGFMGYRFGIGFLGYRFGIGFWDIGFGIGFLGYRLWVWVNISRFLAHTVVYGLSTKNMWTVTFICGLSTRNM